MSGTIFNEDTSTQGGTPSFVSTTYNTKENPNIKMKTKCGIYNSSDNLIKIFTNDKDALTINENQIVIFNSNINIGSETGLSYRPYIPTTPSSATSQIITTFNSQSCFSVNYIINAGSASYGVGTYELYYPVWSFSRNNPNFFFILMI